MLRKLQIKRDPSNAEIRQFLREFDKNRYEETFIAECKITELKKQVKDGVVIELSTPPLEKFRLIFPLAEAVKIIDLAETHEAALALWEDKITGLVRNVLGVHFDRSCTDPSRLFFTARHPKDADDWYSAVVTRGRCRSFASVQQHGALGDDIINGGDDSDYAVFSGNRADYALERSGNVVTAIGIEGADTLIDNVYFRFSDGDVAIWDL